MVIALNKKILVLSNSDIGLWNFRKELFSKLSEEGFDVYISCPFGNKVPLLVSLGFIYMETAVDRRGKNMIRDAFLFFHYIRLLSVLHPDLVMTYTIKPNLYGGIACRIKKIPYFINVTGLGTVFQRKGLLRLVVTRFYRTALKAAFYVLFENEENLNFFTNKKIVRGTQAVRMHGAGVNLTEFPFKRMIPCDECRFLFIGRIMKEKGVDELLAASKTIRTSFANAKFLLIGEYQEDYAEKIQHAAEAGNIRYMGFQADIRPFIERCHCVVLPSYHEGLSNALLEAAAMGRPLIASDIPGCREVILPGTNGYLCTAKSAGSLVDSMKKFMMLDDECKQKMGSASRMLAENRFDRGEVVEKTAGLVRQIMNRPDDKGGSL